MSLRNENKSLLTQYETLKKKFRKVVRQEMKHMSSQRRKIERERIAAIKAGPEFSKNLVSKYQTKFEQDLMNSRPSQQSYGENSRGRAGH